MTTLEILKGARELLSDPARWTQGHAARTAAGRKTSYQDPDAVCYCPWGALRLVGGLGADLVVLSLGFEGTSEFFAWNDAPERTHTEVLARFDKAVARL
jgi:hypothetical protein